MTQLSEAFKCGKTMDKPEITTESSSCIFVRQATVLDCAVFHPNRGPVGHSWWVDVEWEGILDSEGVVFDFGLAKKSAKKCIDEAFDHRLLLEKSDVYRQSERCTVLSQPCGEIVFAMETYPNALAELPPGTLEALCLHDDKSLLEKELAAHVLLGSPKNVKNVVVTLREHEDIGKENHFSYTHSLKNHFGNCQRFHGHSNVIEVFLNDKIDPKLCAAAKAHLEDRYLVSTEYVKGWEDTVFDALRMQIKNSSERVLDASSYLWLSYVGSQGPVQIAILREKPLLLDAESSIENISSYVLKHFQRERPELKNLKVIAYEGLGKGSVSRSRLTPINPKPAIL